MDGSRRTWDTTEADFGAPAKSDGAPTSHRALLQSMRKRTEGLTHRSRRGVQPCSGGGGRRCPHRATRGGNAPIVGSANRYRRYTTGIGGLQGVKSGQPTCAEAGVDVRDGVTRLGQTIIEGVE
eukprot:6222200-Amphidinium_carterae.2